MIKAVIVDDEANIREAVARMVQNCCPNVSILAQADGGFLVMIDGARVPVASRKRDMLMELFEGLE